jgi:hypothetical protein
LSAARNRHSALFQLQYVRIRIQVVIANLTTNARAQFATKMLAREVQLT